MAHSKRPTEERPAQAPPTPEELRDVEDSAIRSRAGEPADAFSLDFPATLTAIVHSEEGGGFSAEVPALPGCFTEGETLEELRENLREAAEGWLKAHHDLVSADLPREALKGLDAR